MDELNLTWLVLAVVASVMLSMTITLLCVLSIYFVSGRLAASRIADIREDVDSLRRSNRRTARAVSEGTQKRSDADIEAEGIALLAGGQSAT